MPVNLFQGWQFDGQILQIYQTAQIRYSGHTKRHDPLALTAHTHAHLFVRPHQTRLDLAFGLLEKLLHLFNQLLYCCFYDLFFFLS